MSTLSSPRATDYHAGMTIGPQPHGSPRWPRFVAWTAILLSVAAIVAANLTARHKPPKDPANDLTMGLKIQARTVVGFAHTLKSPSEQAKLAAQFQRTPRQSDVERLRATIITAELRDRAAAAAELRQLQTRGLDARLAGDAAILEQIYTRGPSTLTVDQRSELHRRHGWFGDLAVSLGMPDASPERRAALWPAYRAALATPLMLVVVCLLGMSGLVLLITAIVLRVKRKLAAFYRPVPGSGVYAEAFALYLGSAVLIGILIRYVLLGTGMWLSLLAFAMLPLALVYPRLRGRPWSELRQALGLNLGRGIVREVLAGIAGYAATFPLLMVAYVVVILLSRFASQDPSHPIVQELSRGPAGMIGIVVLASIWAPITEELLFRGYLFSDLRPSLRFLPSAVIVALIFAAIHPQGWAAIPFLATLAVGLALLREWRGSIIPAIVAHCLHNSLTVGLMLLVLA